MPQDKGRRIKTRISPDFLDTIGKSFKFKHGKGVAEWLKNSLDQYLRLLERKEESLPGNWPVFIHLIDGAGQSKGPNLAVVDFGGTTYKEIDKFFLYWGDTSAASHGRVVNNIALTGGHGNGGKFYMREMWRDGARFLTWLKGKTTSLIVKKMDDRSTGLFELEDVALTWQDAFAFALSKDEYLCGPDGMLNYLNTQYAQLVSELNQQRRGFSIVVGRRAVQATSANDVVSGGKWRYQQLIDDICDAQQALRPIRELCISVFINGQVTIERLTPRAVEGDANWPVQKLALLASSIEPLSASHHNNEIGTLSIFQSVSQLTGRLRELNALFVADAKANPIASYPIHELNLPGYSPLVSFVHAELQLSFPEISEFVTNDRERLVDSAITRSILEWVGSKIWERIRSIEKATQEKKHRQDLEIASKLNDSLNKHAQRFLKQVQTEILVDYVPDTTGGGPGTGGAGSGGVSRGTAGSGKRQHGRGGGQGEGGDAEKPGSNKHVHHSDYPKMLLSSYDLDPAKDYQETKHLTERHPPLHQDDVDKTYNVWWLNTSHPYAEKALRKGGGPEGLAFKSHQLSMFRDMVQREALRILQRREAELPLDRIENELDERSNQFLSELPWNLVERLLE